jgi:predicted nucleotidyltransferase
LKSDWRRRRAAGGVFWRTNALEKSPPKSELVRVAEILERHQVEFIVIGGQAESLYGSDRITMDVDICYRRTRENMQRLAEALREIKPTLRGAPADLPFQVDWQTLLNGCNFTFCTSIVDLDLLGMVEPLGGFEELKKKAMLLKSHGVALWTIDLDDLIKVKQHIKRPKDQLSLMHLLAIKRVRDESKAP